MSVWRLGQLVSVRLRTTPASTNVHGPWQITATGFPASTKPRANATASGLVRSWSGLATPPGNTNPMKSSTDASATAVPTGNVPALSRWLNACACPGFGAMSTGWPPACSTAFHGSVNSTCSMPSLATRNATLLPSRAAMSPPPSIACWASSAPTRELACFTRRLATRSRGKSIAATAVARWHRAVENYEPVMTFDAANAAVYDDLAQRGDEDATVAFLEELGRGGRALELAIGTGRIALPLAQRGVSVDGIDFSPHMVAKLRAKPGGDAIDVTLGDFAAVDVSRSYRLIYVVFNSFFNLLTQDDQVRCFENVAAHLEDGGAFVVEGGCTFSFIDRLRAGQYVQAEGIAVDSVRFDLLQIDPVTQLLSENHVQVSTGGVTFNPVVQRVTWPGELDLLARIAGLRLEGRWGGWHKQPFNAMSDNIVSLYTH